MSRNKEKLNKVLYICKSEAIKYEAFLEEFESGSGIATPEELEKVKHTEDVLLILVNIIDTIE